MRGVDQRHASARDALADQMDHLDRGTRILLAGDDHCRCGDLLDDLAMIHIAPRVPGTGASADSMSSTGTRNAAAHCSALDPPPGMLSPSTSASAEGR